MRACFRGSERGTRVESNEWEIFMSRTGKTAINSIVGLGCSVLSSLLSFVLRAQFIRLLGLEYAGINTLFSDILSILNLAELGFNNAILYRLYKSIAGNDKEKTELYLATYRKLCVAVGAFVGIVGLCFIPFLGSFINKTPTFSEPLWSLYVIVLITSVANHCLNYKSILLIAKQDRYIATAVQYLGIFLRNGLQIAVLAIFKNIYLYLLVALFTTILNGLLNGVASNKRYNETWRSDKKLDKAERNSIVKDVGALSIYKLCRTIDATIDTFLISKFVDVTVTAIYGSVTMLLNALNELLGVFNDAMIASIGDLNASHGKNELEKIFYQSFHFTFLIYGICTATLVPFLSEFTNWWIGYTLDAWCIYIMLLNFLMYGFGMNVATFRNAMGIFQKGWIRPAFTAAFNLVFSFILVNRIGLLGTLFGTMIARTLTLVWYDPWLVLHHGMHSSAGKYYIRYVLYLLFVTAAATGAAFICAYLPMAHGLFALLLRGFVSLAVSTGIVIALGFVVPEQKAILARAAQLAKSILRKK